MPLSAQALKTLHQVRWTEAYSYAVDPVEEKLRALGHTVTPAARVFLARFGGLQCIQPSPYQPGTDAWHTDAEEAAGRLWAGHLRTHELEIGARLTPIGESGYGWLTLLMDEVGRVYTTDQHLALDDWSESGEEMFDRLTCNDLKEPAYGSPAHIRQWRRQFKLD